MKKYSLDSLVILSILLTACGSPATVAPTAAAPTVAARPNVLHIESPDDADISDIPRMMMIEALKADGYTIEPVSLADTNLTTIALEKGDLDLAVLSNEPAWLAITKGTPLVTIMDETVNTRQLVAINAIQSCADLDGRGVGVANLAGSATAMLYKYIEKTCPEAKPDYLVVSGSSSRMAAMLSGDLEVAMLDIYDLIELENQAPGKFHSLAVFSDEFPGLTTTSIIMRRELVEKYPETVKDIVRDSLLARRKIQDPAVLQAEIVKRFDMDPTMAEAVAKLYLGKKVWDVNGGYTPEVVQANIDFLVEVGSLEKGLKTADVADLSFLDAVLAEIGRQ